MIIKAPNKIEKVAGLKTVFLAGSIEMGTAENWQNTVASYLDGTYVILNPRRDDWDSSWTQSYDNLQFRDQVSWEQIGIKNADAVVFYFDKDTQSPITLLELGQCIGMGKKIIVCCPKEFWRYGNIEVMCHLNNVTLVNTLQELIDVL